MRPAIPNPQRPPDILMNDDPMTGELNTLLLDASLPDSIATAARILHQGGLVVFPTDTVYGLAAQAWSAAGIRQLYSVKQRPPDKGIPVLIADREDLERVCRYVPACTQDLIDQFWPGPLTLVLPRHPSLPGDLAPGDTVAVRIPDHEISRAVIRAAGGALATTSANLSGRPPAISGTAARRALFGRVDAIVDDGRSPFNEASTIVDCTDEKLQIVRAGPISAADLGLEAPTT